MSASESWTKPQVADGHFANRLPNREDDSVPGAASREDGAVSLPPSPEDGPSMTPPPGGEGATLSDKANGDPEPSPYLRLPMPVVAIGLVILLVALFAIGAFANRSLRSQGVIVPTPPVAAAGTTQTPL